MALIDTRNKLYRHWDIIRDIQQGNKLYPVNVEFDVSNRCNLKCRWCDFAHIHDETVISLEQSWKIMLQLKKAGAKSLTFSGGGEPTVNPHFPLIVNSAYHFGFDVGLYTNGVVEICKVACRFKWIYVSLDRHRADLYEEVKGAPMFEQVVNNIQKLANLKLPDTTIGLGFLLDGESVRHIYDMVELGKEIGTNYVHFRPLIGLPDYGWVDLAVGVLRGVASDNIYIAWDRFRALKEPKWARRYEICRASALVPCIGANGELWVCPNMRGKRSLGNLLQDDFATLWERRPEQKVGSDCREACRNHDLNEALEDMARTGPHDNFL